MDRILPRSLLIHWNDPKNLIQVVLGPRQVGKTTILSHLVQHQKTYTIYANADLPTPPTTDFIIEHWQKARMIKNSKRTLVLDEIQKIPRWSETVKMLWDQDRFEKRELNVWILGSSAIIIEKGLSESLAGRFELIFFPHWVYEECQRVFKATLEDYIKYGGYPKAYSFRNDEERCNEYIQNSIIEPTLGRDILTLHAVDKPALLRQLFWYVSKLPAHIVSFEKILGHLQGKGNSATLVHYAQLLHLAFMLVPLSKYSKAVHHTKKSIPKWIIPNPALIDPTVRKQQGFKEFVFENIIGGHFLNLIFGSSKYNLSYWREEDQEIDYLLTENQTPILAIEVKSGRIKKLPSSKLLKDKGINCPFVVITPKNIQDFLQTTSIEEVLKQYTV